MKSLNSPTTTSARVSLSLLRCLESRRVPALPLTKSVTQ